MAQYVSLQKFRTYVRNAVIGYVILAAGVGLTFERQQHATGQRRVIAAQQRDAIVRSGTAIAVDGCNRDFIFSSAVRGVLVASENGLQAQHKQGLVTDTQYIKFKAFYDEQISSLPVPDCRNAAKILTDDPNKPIPTPTPLHP